MRNLKYVVLPLRKSHRKHQIMSVVGIRRKDDFQQGEQVLELLLQVNKKRMCGSIV